ncbi:hypothetical protein Ahy_A02g007572 [Arachis hypogaea]|uniref:SWIM-type domain-containing protein n=1 Tax=Arachis hypogaea TaxID=3818 RepID=A0A445ED35_ARAHY|nr:hypothetical protein Ahy_A02g007572 [Arachis hypogaea]
MESIHVKGTIYSGRLASSSWISKKIANNISRGEEMKLVTVIQTIQDKYMANISVGDLKFEVHPKNRMIMERFVVDLMAGRCSCRFWGLCGMSCPHACCAIFEKGDNPKDYCSNYYSKVAYLTTYGQLISPSNEKNMWPKIQCDTIIPPIFKVKPGRPRMVRIREPDENRTQTKYRRIETSVTCSNCAQYGHNRRLCPNPIVTAPEGTQGSDAATEIGGVDAAANGPGAAVEANGSAAAPTTRSRMIRGRGRGRAAVGMGRGRGRGRIAPITAPASRPSNTLHHHHNLHKPLHHHHSRPPYPHQHHCPPPCLHQHHCPPPCLHQHHCPLHQHLNLCPKPKSLV